MKCLYCGSNVEKNSGWTGVIEKGEKNTIIEYQLITYICKNKKCTGYFLNDKKTIFYKKRNSEEVIDIALTLSNVKENLEYIKEVKNIFF